MRVKKCVGVVIYDDNGRVFLMKSPKWQGWLVPGGKIEPGESEEDALRREIREEMGIEITDLERVGEMIKPPSKDFKNDPDLTFHFIDFYAKAVSTDVKPNHEISEHGWYYIEEARKLPLMDTTRTFLEKFAASRK